MIKGKTDLVNHVAGETKATKADTQKMLEAILKGIETFLAKGEEIRLIGFGTFAIQESQAREGRNPRTGEKIKIKASKRPTFRAGKELKDAVNKK